MKEPNHSQNNHFRNSKYLTKGKRGLIFKDKNAIIKTTNPETKAINTIDNEIYWLKKLNKHKIGPKLIEHKNNWFRMEYIKGQPLKDFLKTASKKQLKQVFLKVLKQCRIMDRLKVNKLEMNSPLKHVIIQNIITKKGMLKTKITLLDFERCRYSEKPKNVSQFCSFIQHHLKISLSQHAKEYQNAQTDENFKKIYYALKK